jgi:hypothetical protein
MVTLLCCKTKSQSTGLLQLDVEMDSCYLLKSFDGVKDLRISRDIEIVENTISDTCILGASIITPKQIGKIKYLQIDRRTDAVLDPDSDLSNQPKTSMLCIHSYLKKKVTGKLLIKYSY